MFESSVIRKSLVFYIECNVEIFCDWGMSFLFFWKKKWCWAHRDNRLRIALHVNNGIERQKEMFKYSPLYKHTDSSISGMLTVILEEFLPNKYERWVKFSSRRFNKCHKPAFCEMNTVRIFIFRPGFTTESRKKVRL